MRSRLTDLATDSKSGAVKQTFLIVRHMGCAVPQQSDLPNMGHRHTKSWLSPVIKRWRRWSITPEQRVSEDWLTLRWIGSNEERKSVPPHP
jgi:hypothetical protein